MKKSILMLCLAAAFVGGCRREATQYEPMKAGAPVAEPVRH